MEVAVDSLVFPCVLLCRVVAGELLGDARSILWSPALHDCVGMLLGEQSSNRVVRRARSMTASGSATPIPCGDLSICLLGSSHFRSSVATKIASLPSVLPQAATQTAMGAFAMQGKEGL